MIHRPMLYRLSCAHHSNLQKAGSTLRPNFKTSCVTVESTLFRIRRLYVVFQGHRNVTVTKYRGNHVGIDASENNSTPIQGESREISSILRWCPSKQVE